MKSYSLILITYLLLVSSCQVHQVCEEPLPTVSIPDAFGCNVIPLSNEEEVCYWWEWFADPQLDNLINRALEDNLDISQAWRRLIQARAVSQQAASHYLPELGIDAGYTELRAIDKDSNILFSLDSRFNRTFLRPNLSWEIDLWRRIDSQSAAANYRLQSSCEEVHATRLAISGAVAQLWLLIQEQYALKQLLQRQIQVGETLLNLIEMRFNLGLSTALDVYQQRQQLQSTRLQLPPTQQNLEQAIQQINILLGTAPCNPIDTLSHLPDLPPFPIIGSPCHLLMQRPDLQAISSTLVAADYDVAVAVAERLPSLSLVYSYEFSASNFTTLFDREIGSFAGNIFAPFVDWGRRKAEVERRQAVVCEILDQFSATFLEALGEVEGALTFEREQLTLLKELQKQLTFSQEGLRLAQRRYASGLIDYLPVIAAIQTLQEVERRQITDRKNLLANRIELYLALGGPMGKTSHERNQEACQ